MIPTKYYLPAGLLLLAITIAERHLDFFQLPDFFRGFFSGISAVFLVAGFLSLFIKSRKPSAK